MTNPDTPDSVDISREAIERLTSEYDLGLLPGQSIGDVLRALRAELDKAERGVRVKELVWRGPFPANGYRKGRWNADVFSVVRKGDDYWRVYRNFCDEKDAIYPTPESAKAAAQADYERRILSALEPTPSEWNAAIEAAAKVAETLYDRTNGTQPREYREGWQDMSMACENAIIALKRPCNEKETP